MSIFVFGSNPQGRHGKGAALTARQHFGAIYGQAEGRQGNSYAIITKELRRDHRPIELFMIQQGVERFLSYAEEHADLDFFVSAIGCGLAGFTPAQIGPFFEGAPSNVTLCAEFKPYRRKP